jgi:hypothetical protein
MDFTQEIAQIRDSRDTKTSTIVKVIALGIARMNAAEPTPDQWERANRVYEAITAAGLRIVRL